MKKQVIKTSIAALTVLTAGAVAFIAMSSARDIPDKATAVKQFNQKKYLGKWYEIARLNHKFERNLDNVTASYSLKKNGKIRVENRGYNFKKNKWQDVIGKAKPAGDPTVGMLKVSFFGPFYSGYNVIALDKEYKYALVAGENLKYLWVLSREKTIPESVKKDYLKQAAQIGYDTDALIWVKHDKD